MSYQNSSLKIGRFIDFQYDNISAQKTEPYVWRITSYDQELGFWHKSDTQYRKAVISASGSGQINKTITHNAPISEDLEMFEIGAPVFISGNVYAIKSQTNNMYSTDTTPTNCIPSVKSSGSYKEFIGIVTAKHYAREEIMIGDVVKSSVVLNQDTIDFASHGDFYFRVNDSSIYNTGDTVLYDGTILDDETVMTAKINKMIVGKVTGIINDHMIAVFRT